MKDAFEPLSKKTRKHAGKPAEHHEQQFECSQRRVYPSRDTAVETTKLQRNQAIKQSSN